MMIWVGGRVVPEHELRLSVLDRTFEHGLGLFETLRTYGGKAPLLDRHLARLRASAAELGLPLDDVVLPDGAAVTSLLDAERRVSDVVLRVTLSGGTSDRGGATLWMRTAPLPAPARHDGILVDLGSWSVVPSDPMTRHKALNYWSRRRAYESAVAVGFDEVLSTSFGLNIWEGSRTNLFGVRESTLITPWLQGPLVPGIMRGLVLELAGGLALGVSEVEGLTRNELSAMDEVFLTNSVRGLIPVGRVCLSNRGEWLRWPAPGEWTRRLMILVCERFGSPEFPP